MCCSVCSGGFISPSVPVTISDLRRHVQISRSVPKCWSAPALPIRRSRMNHGRIMSAQLVFPLAAATSGFASGVSCFVPGGGFLFPGFFFGIATVYAVHHTIEVLNPARGAVVILLSMLGFWIGCITSLLSIRCFGGGNHLASDVVGGILAGSAGACVVAVGLALLSEAFRLFQFVALITVTGAVCGAAFGGVIYFHDNANLPHPTDLILGFVIWQVGVASVMPLARKNQSSWPPENS